MMIDPVKRTKIYLNAKKTNWSMAYTTKIDDSIKNCTSYKYKEIPGCELLPLILNKLNEIIESINSLEKRINDIEKGNN